MQNPKKRNDPGQHQGGWPVVFHRENGSDVYYITSFARHFSTHFRHCSEGNYLSLVRKNGHWRVSPMSRTSSRPFCREVGFPAVGETGETWILDSSEYIFWNFQLSLFSNYFPEFQKGILVRLRPIQISVWSVGFHRNRRNHRDGCDKHLQALFDTLSSMQWR